MKKGWTLCILLLLSLLVSAQEEETGIDSLEYEEAPIEEVTRGFTIDAHVIMGIPLGAFSESLDDLVGGFGFRGMVDTKRTGSAIWAGIEIASGDYEQSDFLIDIDNGAFVETFDAQIENSIFLMNGVLRVLPQWNKRVLPYAEGMIGFKTLTTKTKIFREAFDGSEDVETDTNERDWAFQYGLGAGVLIRTSWDGPIRTYIDINVQYLRGTSADYLIRNADLSVFEDPLDAYERKTSTTDLLMPKLGFLIEFN